MVSRRFRLLAGSAAVLVFASSHATFAQEVAVTADGEQEAEAQADAASDGIVVIGTRRTDRSVTDSPSPIDVIGSEELTAQPAVDMLDTVRNIVPSFFVPQNTISDASTFVRPPSLRGLGADQILVMVNGKRYNRAALVQVYSGGDTALSYGSQGADISNIPSISVKNLQILRDGATAQYGSDAIGGVINYVIRDDAGIELTGLYGQTYEGDGERLQIGGYAGFRFADAGFVSLSGEYFDAKGTSRGATRPTAVNFATVNPSLADTIPNYTDGLPAQIWGSSPSDGFKLFGNAGFEFSQAAELYATANYAKTKANQSFNYRPSLTATGLVVDDGSGTPQTRTNSRNGSFNTIYLTPCPAGNATCPAGGFVQNTNTFSFLSIYPGGFTPRFIGEVEQLYGTAGIKGEFANGMTYDLSGTMARNSLSLSMTDSLSASFGPDSQTEFFFGELIQKEQVANLDLTYPIEVGFASPITLSGGAEYRREEYTKTSGDLQSYAAGPYARQPLYVQTAPGVYSFTGTTATQSPAASGYGGVSPQFAGTSSQKSYGLYLGAEADITDKLTAGVAGRYEDYDSFGSAFVWKANALFQVAPELAFRATMGTGFHAPSPGQNNTQIVTTNFRSGNQVQTGTYPTTSTIAQFYGAQSLQPEKSRNYGAGIVMKPTGNFTLTVDGYIINVRNRIGISQTFRVTQADVNALPALAIVGVDGDVNYFTNGFDTSTRGIDAVANWRSNLGGNPLNLTLAYAYNKSEVTDFNPSVISAAQRFNIANLPPRHRINGSANYQIGDFQLNTRVNYFSSWANLLEYPGQRFGGKVTVDLDASYTFMDHFTLTVGANNLFDTYPDRIAPTTTNPIYALTDSLADGQIYPRSGGPFGINGGFYYVRLRVKY